MVTLGQKITKNARRIGQKFDKQAHAIGRKTNNTLTKIDNVIGKSDTVLRKADNTINRVIELGGNNVPGLGQALMVGSELVKGGRIASQASKDLSRQTRGHASDLEKYNSRKYANQVLQNTVQNGYA